MEPADELPPDEAAQEPASETAGDSVQPRRKRRIRWRRSPKPITLRKALGMSLGVHALLLLLRLADPAPGMPGIASPAGNVSPPLDLRVVLAPAKDAKPAATGPAPLLADAAPNATGPTLAPNAATTGTAVGAQAKPRPDLVEPVKPSPPKPKAEPRVPKPAIKQLRPVPQVPPRPPRTVPVEAIKPIKAEEIHTAEALAAVPKAVARAPDLRASEIEAAALWAEAEAKRLKAEADELARAQEEARKEAARQEAVRQEAARLEAARLEAARLEAARQEAARQEAARQEAARQEAVRQEAARQEAARQEAARQEAARQEAARQEAARQEAARQEAARQDAARQEAARQDAARKAAAQEAARVAEQEGRRRAAEAEARRKAAAEAELAAAGTAKSVAPGQGATGPEGMLGDGNRGRTPSQTSSERSVSPASSGSGSTRALETGGAPIPKATAVLQVPLPAPPNPRRKLLTSRADRHIAARIYAESWRQKVEQNANFELLKGFAPGSFENPLVTVALNPDGTVESIVFNKSSGLPEVDDAVRKIVQSLAPFRPFSPDLSQDFDVVEIRYTWTFDTALRLFQGGR